MLPKLPTLRAALVALAASAAALVAPAPARATRGDAGVLALHASESAPALGGAQALTFADERAPALSREGTQAQGSALAGADAPAAAGDFEVSAYELPSLLDPPPADRFEALAGVSLLAAAEASTDNVTDQLVATTKTRVRHFSVLGSTVASVSDGETYTWRWVSEASGLGNCAGLVQGAWTDPTTGIAYHRARWYDPRTASWLSEDPEGDVDSPNLYAFVGWGPQNGTDPMGLCFSAEECRKSFLRTLETAKGAVRQVRKDLGHLVGAAVGSHRLATKAVVGFAVLAHDVTNLDTDSLKRNLGRLKGLADFAMDPIGTTAAAHGRAHEKIEALEARGDAVGAGAAAFEVYGNDAAILASVGEVGVAGVRAFAGEAAIEGGGLSFDPATSGENAVVPADMYPVVEPPAPPPPPPPPPPAPPVGAFFSIPAGSAGGAGAGKPIPQSLRDQWFPSGQPPPLCSYCRMNQAGPLDHVHPRVRNGDLTPANITPACVHCNSSKSARMAPVNPPPGYVGQWPPNWWPQRMVDWWHQTYGP